jgi:hypothetical protein
MAGSKAAQKASWVFRLLGPALPSFLRERPKSP